jgi:hypothetical protein
MVLLEFQRKMKNWIYYHSTGFLNYTSVLSNRLYWWVCQMLHETSFQLLTCIISTVKTGIPSYCNISYSRGGVNQMWILKNSNDLLEYIQSRSHSSCNIIKTFDFSTFYTTIHHSKLKDKLRELVQLCFIKKNGQRRYKYFVLGRGRSYFVKDHSDYTKKFSETDIFNMFEFLIDNIFVIFGGRFFNRQSAYLWVQIVLLLSPPCFFIRMRQTSYRGFSRNTKRH